MLESPDTPTFLGLSGPECHAIVYALAGMKDGLNPFKRKPVVAYEDIDKLTISPEWKQDLKDKYHYYYFTYEAPELLAYLAIAVIIIVKFPAIGIQALAGYAGISLPV